MALTLTPGAYAFLNPQDAAQTVTVTGGAPPYSGALANGALATLSAPTPSPNLYGHSDDLSGSTLSGLTLASGGPGGATDAEYTGTGSASGVNRSVSSLIPVTMGQTYMPSFWIDPSQITNLGSSVLRIAISQADGLRDALSQALTSSTAGRYATSAWTCPTNTATNSDSLSGWSLSSMSLGTGGPAGATDAEYTGTGSAGPTISLSRNLTVSLGSPWTISFWLDWSQVTAAAGKTVGMGDVTGFGGFGNVSPAIGVAAGRVSFTKTAFLTNLIADDYSQWTLNGCTSTASGLRGAPGVNLTSGTQTAVSPQLSGIAAGSVISVSAYWNGGSVTAGTTSVYLVDQNGAAIPGLILTNGSGFSRKAQSNFTIPTGVTSVRVKIDGNGATISGTYGVGAISVVAGATDPGGWLSPSNPVVNCAAQLVTPTVNNGQKVKMSQPMLEPASSAAGYYISSQNPQVLVFTQLLSSAIVASAQKFKISQPMLRTDGVTTPYITSQMATFTLTPAKSGTTTLTISDSTTPSALTAAANVDVAALPLGALRGNWQVRIYDATGNLVDLPQSDIVSIDFDDILNGGSATGTIVYKRNFNNIGAVARGYRVLIWFWAPGGTQTTDPQYGGYIQDFDQEQDPASGTITAYLEGDMKLLDAAIVTEQTNPGISGNPNLDAGTYLQHLASTYQPANFAAASIPSPMFNMFPSNFDGTKLGAAIDTITKQTRGDGSGGGSTGALWTWFVRPKANLTRQLVVQADQNPNVFTSLKFKHLFVGAQVDQYKIQNIYRNIVNVVAVYGAKDPQTGQQVYGVYTDPVSSQPPPAGYGPIEEKISVPALTTSDGCKAYATVWLTLNAYPQAQGTCRLLYADPTLLAGSWVQFWEAPATASAAASIKQVRIAQVHVSIKGERVVQTLSTVSPVPYLDEAVYRLGQHVSASAAIQNVPVPANKQSLYVRSGGYVTATGSDGTNGKIAIAATTAIFPSGQVNAAALALTALIDNSGGANNGQGGQGAFTVSLNSSGQYIITKASPRPANSPTQQNLCAVVVGAGGAVLAGGVTDLRTLNGLPALPPGTTPAIASGSAVISYPNGSGATTYDAQVVVNLGSQAAQSNSAICKLRGYVAPHGAANATPQFWFDVDPTANGSYTLLFQALTAGTQWDLYVAEIDQAGLLGGTLGATPPTNCLLLGTTAANPMSVIGMPAMPNGATFTASSITPNVYDAGMQRLVSGGGAGWIPLLEVNFTMGDTNTPDSTKWGAAWVPYLRAHSTASATDKTTYTRGLPLKQAASSFGNGSAQSVFCGHVTPGEVLDVGVALMDQQGNETALVQLVSNYSVPQVQNGSPVGPIWGKPHMLPTSTDPTNGIWNSSTNALSQGAHDPTVLLSSVTGNQRNLVPDSEFRFFSTYWKSSTSPYWAYNSFWDAATYGRTGTGGNFERLQSMGMPVVQNAVYSLSIYLDATSVVSGGVSINLRSSMGGSILRTISIANGTAGKIYTAPNINVGANSTVYLDVECDGVTMTNGSAVLIVRSPQLEPGPVCTAYRPSHMDTLSQGFPSSAILKTFLPNSLANLVSNITVQTYSSASGSLAMWFTSTTPSSNPGGSTYPSWMYPDQSGGIYPGYINGAASVCGTSSSSPWRSWTGLGGSGVYIGVKYNIATDTFTLVYGPSSTQPTDAQMASCVGDGNIVVVVATATSSSIIPTGGGGGSSFSGGGGRPMK